MRLFARLRTTGFLLAATRRTRSEVHGRLAFGAAFLRALRAVVLRSVLMAPVLVTAMLVTRGVRLVLGTVARPRAVTFDAIAVDVALRAFRATWGAVAVEITAATAATTTAATAATSTSPASAALAIAFAERCGAFAAHDADRRRYLRSCRCR